MVFDGPPDDHDYSSLRRIAPPQVHEPTLADATGAAAGQAAEASLDLRSLPHSNRVSHLSKEFPSMDETFAPPLMPQMCAQRMHHQRGGPNRALTRPGRSQPAPAGECSSWTVRRKPVVSVVLPCYSEPWIRKT